MKGKKFLSAGIIFLIFAASFTAGFGVGFKFTRRTDKPEAGSHDYSAAIYSAKANDNDIIREKRAYVNVRKSRFSTAAQKPWRNTSQTSSDTDSNDNNDNNDNNDKNILFKGVPVLMYHSIAYEKGNDLRVPKELFEQEMKYIRDNGYNTMTLDQLYSCISNNVPAPPKSVVITFDDGYQDNYTNAFPILKKYGLKATVFVITDTVDKNNSYMTSAELRELQNGGIDIESHTAGHDDLSQLSYDAQMKTLLTSRVFLEKLLGKKVRYIAFPCGKFNSFTEKAASDAGYAMAFLTVPGKAQIKQGVFRLHRVRVSSETTLLGFKYLIT